MNSSLKDYPQRKYISSNEEDNRLEAFGHRRGYHGACGAHHRHIGPNNGVVLMQNRDLIALMSAVIYDPVNSTPDTALETALTIFMESQCLTDDQINPYMYRREKQEEKKRQ